ncbi:hypothetical protein CHUAL_009107 [Chamberlinius hualienensis]
MLTAYTIHQHCTRMAGAAYDADWVNSCNVNLPAAEKRVQYLSNLRTVNGIWRSAWLLKAVTCIDLTTLSGDDTQSNAQRLCRKAVSPIHKSILHKLGFEKDIQVAAVCVYPARVDDCVRALAALNSSHINVASVAAGFPSGQYPLETRLKEIKQAVNDGAREIDIVINRDYALSGNWKGVYDEVVEMKKACGPAHMKSILATGELGTLSNIYKASLVAMMAGSDFIKTSTGKETVNATLLVGLVMARAIREFYIRTGKKIGFKPAGGIRTAEDVLKWQILMKEELGNEWLNNDLFRIGASALLGEIELALFKVSFGRSPLLGEL